MNYADRRHHERLRETGGIWLHALGDTPSASYELSWSLDSAGHVARVLRGRKMQSAAKVFDEFGAALQFPDYFGENWDALDECLGDLSWLQGTAYTLLITDTAQVLRQEPAEQFRLFFSVLGHAATYWASPSQTGSTWPHGAVPFHVVVQESPDAMPELLDRLAAMDVALTMLIQ